MRQSLLGFSSGSIFGENCCSLRFSEGSHLHLETRLFRTSQELEKALGLQASPVSDYNKQIIFDPWKKLFGNETFCWNKLFGNGISYKVIFAPMEQNKPVKSCLGGGSKYFLFSSLPGEDSHFD